MDLYRYFHPHHNPRLRKSKLRLQELNELKLATKELGNALKRAQVRVENQSENLGAASDYFNNNLGIAIEALELSLSTLDEVVDAYPEDTDQDMLDMLTEREMAPGWEAWSKLVSEKLFSTDYQILKKFGK